MSEATLFVARLPPLGCARGSRLAATRSWPTSSDERYIATEVIRFGPVALVADCKRMPGPKRTNFGHLSSGGATIVARLRRWVAHLWVDEGAGRLVFRRICEGPARIATRPLRGRMDLMVESESGGGASLTTGYLM